MPKGGRGSRSTGRSSSSRPKSTGFKSSIGRGYSHNHGHGYGYGFGRYNSKGFYSGGRSRFGSSMRRTGGRSLIRSSRSYILPQPPGQFFQNGRLSFYGSAQALSVRFEQLPMEQRAMIRQVVVSLTGKMVQQQAQCCKAMTAVGGILCILPFFLMCCDCYRRNVQALYLLSQGQYQMLGSVLQRCPSLMSVKIYVQDSFLNIQKTQILESCVQPLNLLMFTFSNCVMGLNLAHEQYDNFYNLFANIKARKTILVSVLWDDKYYLTKDYQPGNNIPNMNNMPGMNTGMTQGMANVQNMMVGVMSGIPGAPTGNIPMMPMMPMPTMPTEPAVALTPNMLQPLTQPPMNPLLQNYLNSDPFSLGAAEHNMNSFNLSNVLGFANMQAQQQTPGDMTINPMNGYMPNTSL